MPDPAANASEPQHTLEELLRIMDVATTLRRERERAEVELDHDQTRAMLRKKLLEVAAATGEPVTPAEVEAAIAHYYRSLHAFKPPAAGAQSVLAHAWVRRIPIGVALLLVTLIIAVIWSLSFTIAGSPSDDGHEHARTSSNSGPEIAQRDGRELMREFEFRVANPGGRGRSAFQHIYEDEHGSRVSGYYLVLEVHDGPNQRIRDAISGEVRAVNRWAELIPEPVYLRLREDKKSDGILDETVFARKRSGSPDVEVVMLGADGQPIERRRQLLEWERRR